MAGWIFRGCGPLTVRAEAAETEALTEAASEAVTEESAAEEPESEAAVTSLLSMAEGSVRILRQATSHRKIRAEAGASGFLFVKKQGVLL